jgi:glutamate-1-semialdehyde 2,1-aminomutase
MFGLFFAAQPPNDYRAWKKSDYSFYDKLARYMQDHGIICEPDSREPLFMCEAHDQSCLDDTLRAFETSVDLTLEQSD